MPYYQSLYDILGISKSASADEGELDCRLVLTILHKAFIAVRKAYRKKALETHPDKLSPHASAAKRQAAEAQFHLVSTLLCHTLLGAHLSSDISVWQIHSAFETLSDPHRRKVRLLTLYITCPNFYFRRYHHQAYDAWGSKLDPQTLLEESTKRMADRDAWASNLKAEYERRKGLRSQTMPPVTTPVPKAARPATTTATNRPAPSSTPSTTKGRPPPVIQREPPPPPLSDEEEKLIAEILQEVRAHLPPEYEERRRKALQVWTNEFIPVHVLTICITEKGRTRKSRNAQANCSCMIYPKSRGV